MDTNNDLRQLFKTVKEYDHNLFEHSKKVAWLTKLFVDKLNIFNKREKEDIYYISLLHDIGKTKIAKEVLNKPSVLTDKEWALIKRHTEIGADILIKFSEFARSCPIVFFHHERWDGKGYYGLSGQVIPQVSRIIAITDSFEAMTADRPYKKPLALEEAFREIKRNSGLQFDPELAHSFLQIDNYIMQKYRKEDWR